MSLISWCKFRRWESVFTVSETRAVEFHPSNFGAGGHDMLFCVCIELFTLPITRARMLTQRLWQTVVAMHSMIKGRSHSSTNLLWPPSSELSPASSSALWCHPGLNTSSSSTAIWKTTELSEGFSKPCFVSKYCMDTFATTSGSVQVQRCVFGWAL